MSRKRRESGRQSSATPEAQQQDKNYVATANTPTTAITTTPPPPLLLAMPPHSQPLHLLVASIGNPSPYLGTLHSAGHTVLSLLREKLCYPSFRKSAKGAISSGEEYSLFQSGAYMNVSGPTILGAWRGFLSEGFNGERREAGLVVLHDELDIGLGEVKVRDGELSPRGHNGLKSVKESLAVAGVKWVRIGVGIGRPVSRDPDAVAAYVLRKMTAVERGKLDACTSVVEAELRRISSE